MKKIFFIFAMMLMSVVSALAEESSVEYDLKDLKKSYNNYYVAGYIGSRIIVEGESGDKYGLYLSDGNKITIRSKNGEIITKVEFVISYGQEIAERLNTTDGDKHVEEGESEGFIDNINATSLTISSDVDDDWFQIESVVVYYEIGEDATLFDLDEYMQTETFATTTGNIYSGKNVDVTRTRSDDNGLYIGEGNTITIRSKDNKSLEILKVDLDFNSNVNGSDLYFNSNVNGSDLYTQAAINIDGSEKSWSVSNINSSRLTLAIRNGIAQVNNIKVYYVEVSEEKTVTFPTVYDEKYYENNIAVSGTQSSSEYGLDIDKGNSVTITSDNGVLISKVDLQFSYYDRPEEIESTAGTVAGSNKNWTISGVNSSNLTISHPGEGKGRVQIKEIKVHYREVNAPSTMELTAAFAEGKYWTTFYSAIDNYQAPEGTQVFTVNLDGNTIKTTEIGDGIVTKGQGVMLKSSTGNIVMTKVDNGSSDSYLGNSLVGTSHSISNPGNAYVLNYKTSRGVAFYKLSSTGTIGANKAYLVANSTAAARAFFAFDTDATTGIDKVNAQNSEKEVKAFDLQGRRVAKPANGLYIVNGKKVIMK